MSNFITFNVVSTGERVEGFDAPTVRATLEGPMRLPPAQAEKFFDKRRILKKGLMQAEAEKICRRLAKLGIVTEIEKVEPRLNKPIVGLELEPVDDEEVPPAAGPENDQGSTPQSPSASGTMSCPKCGQEQAASEQCTQCGVWFHKIEQATPSTPEAGLAQGAVASMAAGASIDIDDVDEDEDLPEENVNLKAMGAAAAAALVGALVWKFVAVAFGYELGVIAWGIGGAVGFAAASLGSQGMKAGVICGLLALAAIGLGKYWATEAAIGEIRDVMTQVLGDQDTVDELFDEYVEDARIFKSGSGSDEFVRQFMVDRAYTEETNPAAISNEELQDFREYNEPDLRQYDPSQSDADGWATLALGEAGSLSTTEIMLDSLGFLDLVFLFLGVGTAFKLGRGLE